MEPPAKRLRILQSVEVDETNPEYIDAKRKQEAKFKGRLESIFAKYESMHESMSDEIDMRSNEIVVDRGHLRRLQRQVNRKETVLLDTLGLTAGQDVEDEAEDEAEQEDSEDELAPTEEPSARNVRTETKVIATPKPNPLPNQQLVPQAGLATQPVISMAPNTPNPAANLLQFVHFPQTPAGQQAQTSFYATLAQTINHAVQQAVAPLFSSILPNASNLPLPATSPIPIATTPAVEGDTVKPATDPKWFFPPLSATSCKPEPHQSSPLPTFSPLADMGVTNVVIEENESQEQGDVELQEQQEETEAVQSSPPGISTAVALAKKDSEKYLRRNSPRVEVQRSRKRRCTGHSFTVEDNIHISKGRLVHHHTWAQIKESKDKWKQWPLHIFHHHWRSIKDMNLHLRNSPNEFLDVEEEQYHLPTPSSLGREDEVSKNGTKDEFGQNLMSSSIQFNEDERDLLSIAGSDQEEDDLPAGNADDEFYIPDADEVILPSVELAGFVDEDTLQQGLLEDSPYEDMAEAVVEDTVEVKIEPPLSSPISKRTQRAPLAFQASPDTDSEDEIPHAAPTSSTAKRRPFVCEICKASFISEKNLQRHLANPRSKHTKPPRNKNPSLNLTANHTETDDELQIAAPTTPFIKREYSTPPPLSLLFSTPAPQSRSKTDIPSSTGAQPSSGGLSRKAYLKQVKQSWARRTSGSGSKAVAKRKSFQEVPRKRAWAEVEGSEDELA